MHVRKLVKAGASSHTIALPVAWLKRNGLSRGDTVVLVERSPTELVLTPSLEPMASPSTEATISVDGKQLDTIQREITAAYLNNYGSITLAGASLPKIAKRVREMLHDFVALEITEQTGRQLVAKDLLNLEEIAVDKTIRRMDMMLRSLIKDATDENASSESALLRDQDINRLFFLLYRLLKRSIEDHAMAQRLKIPGSQLLSTWAIIHHLENLADIAARLPEALMPLKKNAQQDCRKLIQGMHDYYLEAMKAYYGNDRALADKVASQRLALVQTHKNIISVHPDLTMVEFSMNMTTMASLVADIARVVIDAAPSSSGTSQEGR